MNTAAPRVYITQEMPKFDYTAAQQYGIVTPLTIMDFKAERESIINQALVEELRTKLESFDPERDYILTSGSPLVVGAVFALVREKTTSFRVLKFDNRAYRYTPLVIEL